MTNIRYNLNLIYLVQKIFPEDLTFEGFVFSGPTLVIHQSTWLHSFVLMIGFAVCTLLYVDLICFAYFSSCRQSMPMGL